MTRPQKGGNPWSDEKLIEEIYRALEERKSDYQFYRWAYDEKYETPGGAVSFSYLYRIHSQKELRYIKIFREVLKRLEDGL